MKLSFSRVAFKGLGAVGAFGMAGMIGIAAAGFVACSSDNTSGGNGNTDGGGGGGDSGAIPPAGPACKPLNPGDFPTANCSLGDQCPAQGGGACDEGAACKGAGDNACLALAKNDGKKTLDFRIRRLNVAAPEALAKPFVQNTVVTNNIDLANLCGEGGLGAFNWLLQVDTENKTLTTGGAPLTTDPIGTGYCFYKFKPASSPVFIEPATVALTDAGNGKWTGAPADRLNIPIFLDDGKTVIILPISQATVKEFTVSENGNCIGAYNPSALDKTCTEVGTCERWRTNGSLGGYITLEQADTVQITQLSESLCVLLTSSKKTDSGGCERDGSGKIVAKGDYCSTSNSPGGCQDSFWLAATFAASAVNINDGSAEPLCQGTGGGGQGDAGAKDASAD